MSARPPRWARALAELVVRGGTREFVLGDLEEAWTRAGGGMGVTLRYVGWTLGSALHALRDQALPGLLADVRIALRQLRRHPRVHLGGALVLAVGLGIPAVTWGVRYGALGRSLPVSEPERIVAVSAFDAETGERGGLSPDDRDAILTTVRSLDAIALWTSGSASLSDGSGTPAKVDVEYASADLFRIFELTPLHGRVLLAADEASGSPVAAVLGYRFWRERYGEDPAVVGRSVRLDGEPVTVVGVLAPGDGLTAEEDFWLTPPLGARDNRSYFAIGRLRAGAAREEAERELGALSASLRETRPQLDAVTLRPETFTDGFYGRVESVRDRVLSTGGLLLLVMALANVANLFLVHARVRASELSVRRALGASRAAILRHLAVEAAFPALLGSVGAVAIAAWGLAWYQRAADDYGVGFVWQLYRVETPHLALIALGALSSTVVVSLVAGTRAWLAEPTLSARSGRGNVGHDFRGGRTLLGVEVAVGAALLLLASLMIRSAWNLRTVDYGFTTEGVMTGDITLAGPRYDDPAERSAFWTALQRDLAGVAGVRQAAVGTQLPMIRCCGSQFRVELEGWSPRSPEELPAHYVNAVTETYFDAFERPVLHGRGITATDGPDGDPVVVVNEPFVARYLAGDIPLGRRLRVWRGAEPGPWRTIVGVAPHLWMDTDVNEHPEGMYVPLTQTAPAQASVAVRVSGDAQPFAATLRAVVARIDPELPVSDVRTMPQLIRNRTRLYRREGPLFALLGVAALVLATAGLHFVVSYLASLRTAELGLRCALGASRSDLIRRSVARVATPTVVGAALGLGVGLSITRGFDRFVFLVDPWSPAVVAATAVVLLASSVGASLIPAMRASRVDPVSVLRSE